MAHAKDHTFSLAQTPQLDLQTFLGRPIPILEQNWANAQDFYAEVKPLHAYLSSWAVKSLLNYYCYIQADVHIKVVVNAAPSFYGAALCAWYPMKSFNAGSHHVDLVDRHFLVPMSQRAHLWLRPQQSEGGEMILPFVWHKNWIPIAGDAELQDFGSLYISSVEPLRNASGATSNSIDITVFAWLENVKVAHTMGTPHVAEPAMTAQAKVTKAKDEFTQGHTGPISSVASTVATVAGRLSDVPVIGPFAKSFNIAGNAIAGIASIFGWSRVPILKPVTFIKPVSYAPLAITDQPEPVDRLTFTSKQGLTVDPRTAGLFGADELTIASIATRESYYTKFEWKESDDIKTVLFARYVSVATSAASVQVLYMTPMAFAAVPFKFWSGDIIVRFQVICSQFHRGRLLVQFDPRQDKATETVSPTNVLLSQVMDISVTRDFEFRIPYASDRAFLEVAQPSYDLNAKLLPGDLSRFNGAFKVSVLNRLTSLSGTGDVFIMVSVRAAENMKFAAPRKILDSSYSLTDSSKAVVPAMATASEEIMTAQSAVMDARLSDEGQPVATEATDFVNQHSVDDNIFDVYFGEQVVSFRSLLRRYARSGTFGPSASNTTLGNNNIVLYALPRFPLPHGFTPGGPTKGTVSATTYYYNFTDWTLFNYLSNAFLGMRGGMRWKIVFAKTTPMQLHYGRSNETPRQNYFSYYEALPPSTSIANTSSRITALLPEAWEGAGIVKSSVVDSVEFEAPHYSPYRFYSTDGSRFAYGWSDDGSDTDTIKVSMYDTNAVAGHSRHYNISTYSAIGDDFNFFWFQGVPSFYNFSFPVNPAEY